MESKNTDNVGADISAAHASTDKLRMAFRQLEADRNVVEARNKVLTGYLQLFATDFLREKRDGNHKYKCAGNELRPEEVQGLVARLSRLGIHAMASDQHRHRLLKPKLDPVLSRGNVIGIRDSVRQAFEEWLEIQHDDRFVPEREFPVVQEARKRRGPGFEHLVVPHLDSVNQSLDLPLWGTFERVRSAAYVVINKENYREFMPRIEETYNQAWLDSSLLQGLQDDPDGQRKFKQRTSKGAFIHGFRERQGAKPSVADQMVQDFESSDCPNTPRYEGRCLLDDDGKLLAWLTFWHTPRQPSEEHRNVVLEYLHRGVSGRIEYYHDDDRVTLEKNVDYITRIDTIWRKEDVPLAARRLFAKTITDIRTQSPHQQYLLGYHFWELYTYPRRYLHSLPLQHADNESSYKFFHDRGCKSIALDSDEAGPVSYREFPDNERMCLRPAWMVFAGPMDEIYKRSIALWRRSQRQYGDPTSDDARKTTPVEAKQPDTTKYRRKKRRETMEEVSRG